MGNNTKIAFMHQELLIVFIAAKIIVKEIVKMVMIV